jgi:FtsZ-binding cell division protein ZapB
VTWLHTTEQIHTTLNINKHFIMKSVHDIVNQSDNTFDGLLDEINSQKRVTTQLQTENRKLKTNEIRINKMAESLKSNNNALTEEIQGLLQRVRELEIQLTLPTNERTLAINRSILEPFPRKKDSSFKWAYVITPILAIFAVFMGKSWGERAHNAELSTASIAAAATGTPSDNNTTASANMAVPAAFAPPAATNALPENYLMIENPLEKDGMVRVLDGFEQKARVLAWINPSEKYKIRAQSPEKKRRTYVKDGQTITVEDFFYKISEKEQWVHGYFTNKRTYTIH